MRKEVMICDGCEEEYPGGLSRLMLRLSWQKSSDIADLPYNYDFCSVRCLGRWIGQSAHKVTIEKGMNDV